MNNSDKHSSIQRVLLKVCAVLCAIILTINPVKVNAMNPVLPIPPIWLPINPYNTESIVPNAELLNEEQKNILYEIIGAYNHIYLGFGGYILTNPISGVKQWWREYGETFYNSFVESVVGSSRALIDMVGSATYKASQYDTLQEFEQEISDTSVSNYIEYNPELTIAFRDWYFNRGGVYQWQFQTKPFETTIEYRSTNMTQGVSNNYWTYLGIYTIRSNAGSSSRYNYRTSSDAFNEFTNLLFDTDDGKVYMVNDNGEYYYTSDLKTAYVNSDGSILTTGGFNSQYPLDFKNTTDEYSYCTSSLLTADTYVDAVREFYNTTRLGGLYYWQDIIKRVFVGADWSHKQQIYNIDDLDISGDTSTYVDNIGTTGYTDINGLASSLGADIVDIKQGVLDNTLVKTEDGTQAEQLTDLLLKAIDKFMSTPSSGVVIPTGIFAPVKGFMEYMWYMTKPLIVFTRDVISTLTFGAADGFLNTGPAIFVFGVCAFGLIGGLIVKCLL